MKTNYFRAIRLSAVLLVLCLLCSTLFFAASDHGVVLQVAAEKGVVSVSGLASEDAPVQVLVTGCGEENRMMVCEVVTVSSASAAKTIDTNQWKDCIYVHTFILDEEYAPISPVISFQ